MKPIITPKIIVANAIKALLQENVHNDATHHIKFQKFPLLLAVLQKWHELLPREEAETYTLSKSIAAVKPIKGWVNEPVTSTGDTILLWAARQANSDLVAWLLKQGAAIFLGNKYGFKPCFYMMQSTHLLELFWQAWVFQHSEVVAEINSILSELKAHWGQHKVMLNKEEQINPALASSADHKIKKDRIDKLFQLCKEHEEFSPSHTDILSFVQMVSNQTLINSEDSKDLDPLCSGTIVLIRKLEKTIKVAKAKYSIANFITAANAELLASYTALENEVPRARVGSGYFNGLWVVPPPLTPGEAHIRSLREPSVIPLVEQLPATAKGMELYLRKYLLLLSYFREQEGKQEKSFWYTIRCGVSEWITSLLIYKRVLELRKGMAEFRYAAWQLIRHANLTKLTAPLTEEEKKAAHTGTLAERDVDLNEYLSRVKEIFGDECLTDEKWADYMMKDPQISDNMDRYLKLWDLRDRIIEQDSKATKGGTGLSNLHDSSKGLVGSLNHVWHQFMTENFPTENDGLIWLSLFSGNAISDGYPGFLRIYCEAIKKVHNLPTGLFSGAVDYIEGLKVLLDNNMGLQRSSSSWAKATKSAKSAKAGIGASASSSSSPLHPPHPGGGFLTRPPQVIRTGSAPILIPECHKGKGDNSEIIFSHAGGSLASRIGGETTPSPADTTPTPTPTPSPSPSPSPSSLSASFTAKGGVFVSRAGSGSLKPAETTQDPVVMSIKFPASKVL